MLSTYKTVATHLLYSDVIENDGRITREPTFLGAVLIGIALFAAGAFLIILGAAL